MKRKIKVLIIIAAIIVALIVGFAILVSVVAGRAGSSDCIATTYEEIDAEAYGEASADTGVYETTNVEQWDDKSAEIDVSSADYETDSVNDTDTLTDTEVSTDADSTGQKLVVTWSLTMETEQYDNATAAVRNSVETSGGYIEEENESDYGDSDRYVSFTIRVPEDQADEWVDDITSYGTIVDRSRSTDDITLNYIDTESRLSALRTEQETLTNMMKSAQDMTDLITIQAELTDVNAEIESYESQLRTLDNQVQYTTIYLYICEVNREVAQPQTFGTEIRETFLNSIDILKNIGRHLVVGIIGNSVMIIIAVAIIAAVVLVRKKMKSRKHGRNEKTEDDTTEIK